MKLAVGMVSQGDDDSGAAMVLDCKEIRASVLEADTDNSNSNDNSW